MKKITIVLFVLTTIFSNAQTLSLDLSFGNNGFATLPINSDGGSYNANKVQTDGKIIISGQRLNGSLLEDYIARYNQDGTLDSTFGENGFYIIIDSIDDVNGPKFFILNNDKIIYVVGDVQGEITKLNTNGTIDNTFGNNGKINFNFINDDTAYLDSNENLYIGTGTNNELIKINTINGTFDSSFGSNGIINLGNSFFEINSFNNSKFLIRTGGVDLSTNPFTYFHTIKRYDTNGIIDTTFGTNGTLLLHTTTNPFDFDYLKFNINVDDENNYIYITKSNYNDFSTTIQKFDLNGNLLPSFGNFGTVNVPPNNYIITSKLDNGKLYLIGSNNVNSTYNSSILRYNTDGLIDTTFNTLGQYIENTNDLQEWCESISISSDGSILVSGEYFNGNLFKTYLAKYILSNLSTNFIDNNFSLDYKNPVSNLIEFVSNKTIKSIDLYNIDGKKVTSSNTNSIEVTNLEIGIYIAKITSTDDRLKSIKFIKN